MGTQRWYERLALTLLPEPVVDQSAAGRLTSAQLVNDARWMSSREGNPRGYWSLFQSGPGAGEHTMFCLTNTLPGALTGIAIHQFSATQTGILQYASVNFSSLVFVAGTTTLAPIWSDADVTSRITFRFGDSLSANLPTAQANWNFNNGFGFQSFHESSPLIWTGPGDTLVFWQLSANQAASFSIVAQSVALPL